MTDLKSPMDPSTLVPSFDWCESDTLLLDDSGNLSKAGTCLKLNDYIIFLSGLTEKSLGQLKDSVNKAVDHEITKRSSTSTISTE